MIKERAMRDLMVIQKSESGIQRKTKDTAPLATT